MGEHSAAITVRQSLCGDLCAPWSLSSMGHGRLHPAVLALNKVFIPTTVTETPTAGPAQARQPLAAAWRSIAPHQEIPLAMLGW